MTIGGEGEKGGREADRRGGSENEKTCVKPSSKRKRKSAHPPSSLLLVQKAGSRGQTGKGLREVKGAESLGGGVPTGGNREVRGAWRRPAAGNEAEGSEAPSEKARCKEVKEGQRPEPWCALVPNLPLCPLSGEEPRALQSRTPGAGRPGTESRPRTQLPRAKKLGNPRKEIQAQRSLLLFISTLNAMSGLVLAASSKLEHPSGLGPISFYLLGPQIKSIYPHA
nr:uncharacterized protein LOC105707125 [Aotus nancymaae]